MEGLGQAKVGIKYYGWGFNPAADDKGYVLVIMDEQGLAQRYCFDTNRWIEGPSRYEHNYRTVLDDHLVWHNGSCYANCVEYEDSDSEISPEETFIRFYRYDMEEWRWFKIETSKEQQDILYFASKRLFTSRGKLLLYVKGKTFHMFEIVNMKLVEVPSWLDPVNKAFDASYIATWFGFSGRDDDFFWSTSYSMIRYCLVDQSVRELPFCKEKFKRCHYPTFQYITDYGERIEQLSALPWYTPVSFSKHENVAK